MARLLLITLLLSAAVSTSVPARTWYITPDGTGDVPTIQDGIDSAAAGDTVLLACGVYSWTNQRSGNSYGLIRMKGGITLRSETGQAGCVTIDGEQQGRVLFCSRIIDASAIEGLTVTGGRNTGGALYCIGAPQAITPLRLADCVFHHNSYPGGAACVACYYSSPEIVDCVFRENSSEYWSGAIDCSYSSPQITGCTFQGNQASFGGGAIECAHESSPVLRNCE